jgi:hypothetical protein
MRIPKRSIVIALSGILVVSTFAVAFVASRAPGAHAASGSTLQDLTSLGSGGYVAGAAGVSGDDAGLFAPDVDADQHVNSTPSNTPPTSDPNPPGNTVINSNGGSGFQGLDHYDTRLGSSDGNNAFSLEPPDQGLCVGHGKIVETINDVTTVFDASGARIAPTTSMNGFFHLPVAINRTTGVRGPFLSDPKCLYDPGTDRFFLTMLEEDAAPSVRTHTLIAVSKTNDPTGANGWFLFSLDTTDDGQNGTPAHAICPCFGDQPLIGSNDDGFFITTNEFNNAGTAFSGAQVYAMSKGALTSGSSPKVVHIDAGAIPTPDAGGIWYSIQPATSPAGNATGQGQLKNTEFFMSALQFGPANLDNRIAVWSLFDTSALASGNPAAVKLDHTVISSETYGNPVFSVRQKVGDFPLGQSFGKPRNRLNPNDDRMNQVVYANGLLYSGLNTVIGTVNVDETRTGIAYFIVGPDLQGHNLSATMVNQGYVSIFGGTNLPPSLHGRNSVIFPSIGVNAVGKGIMTFTVSGLDYYPSAGYVTIDATHGAGDIHIAGAGVGPADGFTGYGPPIFNGNGVERWGDYSAAVADENGDIWMAAEYIAQTCNVAQYTADNTCGHTRTLNANWSTFINRVTP